MAGAKTKKRTLRDWIAEKGSSSVMDGLLFNIPQKYVNLGVVPQRKMRLRSGWGMGGGLVGLWFQFPEEYPGGRTFPITGLDFKKEVETWEILDDSVV
jgi:hypothetical protein